MRIHITILLVVLAWLISCSKSVPLAENKTFKLNNGRVNLSDSLPGYWDKVCIITPYSTNSHAYDLLGVRVDIVGSSKINVSDSITLLVTMNNNEVVKLYEVPRNNINFASLGAGCYQRNESMFSIPETGYPDATHIKEFRNYSGKAINDPKL